MFRLSSNKHNIHSTLLPNTFKTFKRRLHSPRLVDLVLVRHGESEGSVARQRSLRGDHSLFTGEFKRRHGSYWRLTDLGREQARAAGDWLRSENMIEFDRYYVSEYLRSMETAARLELPNARWFGEVLLRERDWGQMELMSEEERRAQLQNELNHRDLDPFFYCPPGGESLASVAQRIDRLLGAMHRECEETIISSLVNGTIDECVNARKAIVVCHGDVMWAFRSRIERLSHDSFIELNTSGRMVDQIHSGHILHYTRRDPNNPNGDLAPTFSWMRSYCPWNPKWSQNHWKRIERPVYDNDVLLATAERVPRMIVSDQYVTDTYETNYEISGARKPKFRKQLVIKKESRLLVDPIKLDNVVIVNKKTRFEHEQQLYGNTGDALRKQMSMRGFVYDRLRASHDSHVQSVQELTECLKQMGSSVCVISANEFSPQDIENATAVISTGGDGTFLRASSNVNKEIPVIGINTDPSKSEGKLCCYLYDPFKDRRDGFEQFTDRLVKGDFSWKARRRIRVVLVKQDGTKIKLPRYALNEVFFAEKDASRPTFYDLGIDQNQRETQRSSGIIICTGTGSSAWSYSASQIHREQVSNVLMAMGHTQHSNDRVTEITEMLNKRNIFPGDSMNMGYFVREPIINETFGEISFRRGTARRISMRSLGWDAQLTLDGIDTLPLDYGVQAVMKIGTNPESILRTIEL